MQIVVNDMDPAACAAIAANVRFNGLSPTNVQPSQADATLLMYLCRQVRHASLIMPCGLWSFRLCLPVYVLSPE